MRLTSIEIEGYRSINQKVKFICDPQVTVVLGANDHGKSNLLSAIRHLNADLSFDEDRDLNWDCAANPTALPHITYELSLDAHEQAALQPQFSKSARDKFVASYLINCQNALDALPVPTEEKDSSAYCHAIIDLIEARYVQENGNVDNALTKGLSEAVERANVARRSFADATKKRASAEADFEKATATGDAEAAKEPKALLDAATLEAKNAGHEASKATFHGYLTQAADLVKKGHYKSKLKEELAGLLQRIIPKSIAVERKGTRGGLHVILPPELDDATIEAVLVSRLPRVELIGPVDKLADSVDRNDISNTDFEFMRGVFYYAGLTKESWDTIFDQNDRTARQLEAASVRLNETLQKSWSQGKELGFKLQHSAGAKIELYISDPVVKDRYVRASRRSTGFTHFFTLKTILYSRQTESPARSYIWLFDEPGLYLHPNGQHDLLQVLETLAISNQIIYSTHSLFMINKNYPIRHRLILKTGAGTLIDGKPYVAQWKSAIDSLGLALPGTILFATKVLLVEGDSDPIFLHSIFLKLIELGFLKSDLNALGIISTGESKNTDALIRILIDTPMKPEIAAIFDGDDGGRARQKNLAKLLKAHGIANISLKEGTTIEDHLPSTEKIFIPAVARYVAKVSGKNEREILAALQTSFGEKFAGVKPENSAGLAAWSRSTSKEIAQLSSEPSSVGIAREYALALADTPTEVLKEATIERAIELSEWVTKTLNLPDQVLEQQTIVMVTPR